MTELTLLSIEGAVTDTLIPLFPNIDTLTLEYGFIGREIEQSFPKLKTLRYVAFGTQINSERLLRKLDRLDFSFSPSGGEYFFDPDGSAGECQEISKTFIALVPTLTQLKRLAVNPNSSRGITFPLGSSSLLSHLLSFVFLFSFDFNGSDGLGTLTNLEELSVNVASAEARRGFASLSFPKLRSIEIISDRYSNLKSE